MHASAALTVKQVARAHAWRVMELPSTRCALILFLEASLSLLVVYTRTALAPRLARQRCDVWLESE